MNRRKDLLNPRTMFFNPNKVAIFRIFAKLFAGIVASIGLLSLIGWLTDIDILTRFAPLLPPIQPIVSLGFLFGGTSLLFSLYESRRAALIVKDILSFFLILLGLITFYESFMQSNTMFVNLLELFVSDQTQEVIPPTISILFICAGFAMLFFNRGKKSLYQYLILLGSIILLPSVIEHIYGIDFIYGFASHTKIALHTTVSFALLFFGILFARPNIGFMSVVSSESAGGYLARRMLIPGMVIPLIIGGIVLYGYRSELYNADFRYLLYISSIIIIFTFIIWRNAKSIHLLDIARRESEQSVYRLAAIVESSDDAIIGRDLKGVITDWNRGAEELYGYKAEEIIGKNVDVLFPKGKLHELTRFNHHLRKGKPIREFEAVRVTKNGTIRPVSITASPIKNYAGKVVGVSAISRDITERKQLERQRELFISIASHELKTPVTSTKAYGQLLKRHFQKKKDAESLSFLKKMDDQLNRLTELIGYLLDVSTMQKGQLRLSMDKIDINTLVTETIEELQRTTSHKIIKEGQIRKKILADKNRITQVLRNLLTNAIKYSPDGDRVIVACETQEKHIKIAITDFGIGIPKEEQKKVFDPLYRSSDAKKEKYSGLGLGLYITREIVKKHGGHLSLTSKTNAGTTITITLPVSKRSAVKSS